MVEKCGSDVGGEIVVVAPTGADHPHQLGGACLAPGPSPVHLLQVAESTGNQMATPRALVEGFAVLEPPVDAEEAAERADDVAALLAAFGNYLHERTAHHLGRHAACICLPRSRLTSVVLLHQRRSAVVWDRVHTTPSSLVPYTVSYKSTVTQIFAQADVFYLNKKKRNCLKISVFGLFSQASTTFIKFQPPFCHLLFIFYFPVPYLFKIIYQ
jgi:hypothetical protein